LPGCWAPRHLGDFAPCFLWVFALAPWIERLEHAQALKGALALVTSAIVGVIANLSVWFALQVLFHAAPAGAGPHPRRHARTGQSGLACGHHRAASGWLIITRKWSVMRVLGLAAISGWLLSFLPDKPPERNSSMTDMSRRNAFGSIALGMAAAAARSRRARNRPLRCHGAGVFRRPPTQSAAL
jgi:hypothetical protein